MDSLCTAFSRYGDTKNPKYATIGRCLERIRTGSSRELVEKIRNEKNEKEQKALKLLLPCICFSGKFKERADKSILEHSGFCVLDFDKVKNLSTKLEELKSDEYIYACWISPRGNGIKALVKIPPDIQSHREYYTGLMGKYKVDTTGINISRICYESYDPEIYTNENSIVWETKIIEKKEFKSVECKVHDYKVVNVAAQMIRNSVDGEKHNVLLKAAKLIGGYIAIGKISEEQAVKALEFEIENKNIDDKKSAMQTIYDGIEYGKNRPITEAIQIERESRWLKTETGDYDFLASENEMELILAKYYDGTIERGLDFYIPGLKQHFLAKLKTFVLFIGIDNVGKSTILWYLSVLTAKFYDWKTLIYSGENDDETVKRKLLEFYICKPFRDFTRDELYEANEFYKSHFKIISSSRDVYSAIQLIEIGQVLFEGEWKFNCFIIEPYNSLKFDTKIGMNKYNYDYYCLSEIRLFTKKYCSVWVAAHTVSEAGRNFDAEGYVKVPHKSQVEGGNPFCSRADDIVILHRNTKSQVDYKVTEFHVDKVKDQDTGGRPTAHGEPIKIRMVEGNCGFIDYTNSEYNCMFPNRKPVEINNYYEPKVKEAVESFENNTPVPIPDNEIPF